MKKKNQPIPVTIEEIIKFRESGSHCFASSHHVNGLSKELHFTFTGGFKVMENGRLNLETSSVVKAVELYNAISI